MFFLLTELRGDGKSHFRGISSVWPGHGVKGKKGGEWVERRRKMLEKEEREEEEQGRTFWVLSVCVFTF